MFKSLGISVMFTSLGLSVVFTSLGISVVFTSLGVSVVFTSFGIGVRWYFTVCSFEPFCRKHGSLDRAAIHTMYWYGIVFPLVVSNNVVEHVSLDRTAIHTMAAVHEGPLMITPAAFSAHLSALGADGL